IEAVVWNNEEGSRFVPGTMGSGVYAGVYPLESALRARDEAGVGMAEAVAALRAALPEAAPRAPGAPMAAFVEAHIEQGPVLEAAGDTIGVVTGIQGARKFAVEVLGAEAHAGTTARAHRKDAFVAAVAIVNALHAAFHDAGDTVRFTVGQFAVWPNARAVVPGRVRFAIDFRHPDRAVLDALGDRVAPIAAAHAGPCRATVTELPRFDPVAFEGAVPDAIARAARARGYRWRALPSGALHDAGHIAAIRPTGMVFVPCAQGISHNEAESADPADLTAGAQVVADVLVDLANRP
ncbi:MAG: M20 family metallo-hydrolase, partial [Alphaproteobacteria bacterium]|nr:M20 family metallo-hydrolase [Alphaproteobacteria bacterium]